LPVVFKQPEKEDQENQQPQLNVGAVAPITPTSPNKSKQPNTPSTSGSFTNLKNYINANKNFNEGEGLAGKIATKLSDEDQKVKNQVKDATTTFNTELNTAMEPINKGKDLVQQAVDNPINFIQNPNNVSSVVAARDADYKGPKSLMDLRGRQNQSALESSLNNLTDRTNQARTETGRFNLLRSMFGRPTYSSGQQNLDNLLIQGQRDQQQKMNQTGLNALKTKKELETEAFNASTLGTNASNDADSIRQQTQKALNNRVLQEQQAVKNALEQARVNQDKSLYNLIKGLQSGQIRESDATKLGLVDGQNIYLNSLKDLVSRGVDPTVETVATKQNYGNIDALRKLIGNTYTQETSGVLDQFKDISNADKFDPSNYNVNVEPILTNTRAAQADPLQKTITDIKGAILKTQENEKAAIQNIELLKKQNPEYADYYDELMQKTRNDYAKFYKEREIMLNAAQEDFTKKFGRAVPINVLGSDVASIDDFDQTDPLTGMKKGEQLLNSLGLLRSK
jgi:hypothetical protein